MTPSNKRGLLAWCLYDWANSAFPTVITTFVFAAYFTKAVAADAVAGTELWGYAMSLSALCVALLSPVFGAVADHAGRRKPWIAFFTLICIGASMMLFGTRPQPSDILWALLWVAIANFGFETAMVFYNAMLPDIVVHSRLGRLSGWGWGLGYLGGLACLVVALVFFVQPETPLFGLDKETAQHVRATGPLVAAWMALFALPLFLWTPDTPRRDLSLAQATRRGLATLADTLRNIRQYRDIVRFLIARMIYTDGLNTLFAFGGIYAAGTFGMSFEDLIIFGIGMNVTAGLGAALFAWVDDRIGPKRTIIISVAALIVLGAIILVIQSVTLFWVVGLSLGIFVGPAQAASRSMMAHMAPPDLRTEMFGLYALSGKATAFLGPALLGFVAATFDSQRAGMATIVVFFAVGLGLLLTVPEAER
ncbi:MAG: MFS transporter [Rhodospirillales bacterium]|nr:MFS transporter [Rhodospirillales bacterium]